MDLGINIQMYVIKDMVLAQIYFNVVIYNIELIEREIKTDYCIKLLFFTH